MFSMMLVQASERRSSAGNPSLLTVRISSNPSRILLARLRIMLLRLRRVVEFPDLAQHTPDRGM
jgi:hypothetical protein